jgi:transglutaminase-like putative cysteine protease
MPEPRSVRLEQFLLLVLICAAVAAFGTAYHQPLVWIFWLPCGVSVFWRIRRVPGWLNIGARVFAHIFEVLALLLGLIFMAYPVLPAETATALTLLAGWGLSLFASLFLLGTAVWPPATTLFPAALGLLVAACFNQGAKHRPLLVGASLAILAYLSLPAFRQGVRNLPATHWLRLVSFVLIAALFAAAVIVVAPQLQSKTENIAFQLFQANMTAYSGLSDATRLGDLEQLKLSSRVVMRVWTDRPQYLRAKAYSHFDGRVWTTRPGRSRSLHAVPPDAVPVGQLREWLEQIPGSAYAISGLDPRQISGSCVRTRIIQSPSNSGMMVSPGNKLLVRADLPDLRVDLQEDLQPPATGSVAMYGVLNLDGEIAPRAPASPQELTEALQLPGDSDPRLHELAMQLAEGASSPEEKLSRTLNYLQQGYLYTLNVGRFHTSQPVAEFLFEKKKGYCQYFASAAAVLLRLEGVPTRYVSGFHVSESNRSGNHYVVRELDAHAWIESYIPGKGWVPADPTPAAEYESLDTSLTRGWLANALEWWQAGVAESLVRMRGDWHGGLRWLWASIKAAVQWFFLTGSGLSVLALMLLAWLVRYLGRGRKADPQVRAPTSRQLEPVEGTLELAALLKRLDVHWANCGVFRPVCRTPLEHLEAIPAEKISPERRKVFRHLIEAYYLASFGGVTLPTDQLQSLQRELDCLDVMSV